MESFTQSTLLYVAGLIPHPAGDDTYAWRNDVPEAWLVVGWSIDSAQVVRPVILAPGGPRIANARYRMFFDTTWAGATHAATAFLNG